MTLAHGGNVYEISSRLGCSPDSILDYSASINPLGPPSGLLDEFVSSFHRLQHYPDIGNRLLIDSIARFHDVPADCVVVGNGSTELIYWLPKVLGIRSAAVALPTFSEYRKAFELEGIELEKLFTSREQGFQPTVEQLESVCRAASPEAVLLTHPGSPSGMLLDSSVVDWIAGKGPGGPVCIIDEVFVDFCERCSLKSLLAGPADRLVIIRSMTKFYGLPGLRIGYLLASEDIARKMRDSLPPWSVNTLAQIAGAYCFERKDYQAKTLEVVGAERERMKRGLEELGLLRVFPGVANYLLVEMDEKLPSVTALRNDLLDRDRILIRDCSSFEGLGDHYFRLAVRMPEQNERLMAGITRWMKSLAA